MIIPHEIQTPWGAVRGYEHRPKETRGIVFIHHGYFSSNHLGPNRLYLQIAHVLCRAGLKVFRFAGVGMGDSDGVLRDVVYDMHLSNHEQIIRTFGESVPMMLLGHSMGTSIAVRLACKFEPARLALVSPSLGKIDQIENLLSESQINELNRVGITERKGLEVRADFMDQSQSLDIFKSLQSLRSELHLFYGLEDELFTRSSVQGIAKQFEAKLTEYEGADHNFLQIEPRNRLLSDIHLFATS